MRDLRSGFILFLIFSLQTCNLDPIFAKSDFVLQGIRLDSYSYPQELQLVNSVCGVNKNQPGSLFQIEKICIFDSPTSYSPHLGLTLMVVYPQDKQSHPPLKFFLTDFLQEPKLGQISANQFVVSATAYSMPEIESSESPAQIAVSKVFKVYELDGIDSKPLLKSFHGRLPTGEAFFVDQLLPPR